uniref:Fungal lipase-type domain-containing protein n=1 Tax=Arcella intermedia TaxID=1963864 RepID=A0A6B2LE66_9EUKA
MYTFAAYCPAETVKSWSCYWCKGSNITVTSVIYDEGTDTSGFVGYDSSHDELIVAFRGTVKTSFSNWITDLDFVHYVPYPTALPKVRVHIGFYRAYLNILGQLSLALRISIIMCPTCNKTVYSGHSLGGALAAIALMDTIYSTNIPQPTPILYTFGQPRTGNIEWAKFMQTLTKSMTRVVHDLDLVPHVPPRSFGFQHVPTEIWMPDKGTEPYIICDASGEDKKCSDGQTALSIADHSSYVGLNLTAGKPYGC